MRVSGRSRPLALLAVVLLAGCSSCRTLPPQRVGLKSIARNHGLKLTETPEGAMRLHGRGTDFVFKAGERRFTLNGTVLYLNAPVRLEPRTHVADQDVLSVIRPLLRPRDCVPPRTMRRVVIDAGHGGRDSGALAPTPKLQEKDVVLDIALRVRRHVAAAGLEVHMTREGDQTLSLGERAQKSNTLKADIFVSVHANAASNKGASGIETFVIPAAGFASTSGTVSAQVHPGNTFDAASLILGHEVHRRMVAETGGLDRGVKRARFSVIRNVRCPGILVEAGFLSNATEAGRLNDPAYRERVARAIAEGIVAYGRLCAPAGRDRRPRPGRGPGRHEIRVIRDVGIGRADPVRGARRVANTYLVHGAVEPVLPSPSEQPAPMRKGCALLTASADGIGDVGGTCVGRGLDQVRGIRGKVRPGPDWRVVCQSRQMRRIEMKHQTVLTG